MAGPIPSDAFIRSVNETFDKVHADVFYNGYYARNHYGKYTIYNREGETVVHGLNKQQAENYMKLLKREE